MPKIGTSGVVVEYKNGETDGRYLLDDDRGQHSAQLTAVRIEKLVEERHSNFQHIAIYDTTYHGKMLVLDGFIQMTVADNFCYHEMITNVPLAIAPQPPKNVLVIGGGDGGVVNQLGKHSYLERIVWIDIDADVVEMCRRHMPELQENHDDRVEFFAMDGADIDYQNMFDLIIVDGTDPLEDRAASLWTKKFYHKLTQAVTDQGIITALGGWVWPESGWYASTVALARDHFENVHYYYFIDPSMKYGHMGVFLMTNLKLDPSQPTHLERIPVDRMEFYNGAVHTAAFALPNCFKPKASFVPY
ncbi:MAG: methyltransferase domain-containing protein [Anaerolineae bacterium]|nr:methyltransferase domain-containing protein [Anaerolineae bacterium]